VIRSKTPIFRYELVQPDLTQNTQPHSGRSKRDSREARYPVGKGWVSKTLLRLLGIGMGPRSPARGMPLGRAGASGPNPPAKPRELPRVTAVLDGLIT